MKRFLAKTLSFCLVVELDADGDSFDGLASASCLPYTILGKLFLFFFSFFLQHPLSVPHYFEFASKRSKPTASNRYVFIKHQVYP